MHRKGTTTSTSISTPLLVRCELKLYLLAFGDRLCDSGDRQQRRRHPLRDLSLAQDVHIALEACSAALSVADERLK